MPPVLEGVLNQQHRNSLEIVDFIFHIIDPDADGDEKVVYLDEVQLQDRQKAFFLERLQEVAEGTQYIFEENAVHFKEKCEQLVADRARFVEISRQITADFSGRHEGNMAAGVFVISIVRYLLAANDWKDLVLLVKMDKKPSFSYSYEVVEGRKVAVMNEVPNSLTETKAAIQKSALIDVCGVFAWHVLAYDRIKRPYIADYYKAFLGITERHHDSVLTRNAHITVKKWAMKLRSEDMPPGEDAFGYTGRGLRYLQDHDEFDTEQFLDAVIRDEDLERKERLIHSLREALTDVGIAGQRFTPKPDSLRDQDKKQVIQTAEGVKIEFTGDKTAMGLEIENLPNNRKRITINTSNVSFKI